MILNRDRHEQRMAAFRYFLEEQEMDEAGFLDELAEDFSERTDVETDPTQKLCLVKVRNGLRDVVADLEVADA